MLKLFKRKKKVVGPTKEQELLLEKYNRGEILQVNGKTDNVAYLKSKKDNRPQTKQPVQTESRDKLSKGPEKTGGPTKVKTEDTGNQKKTKQGGLIQEWFRKRKSKGVKNESKKVAG